MKTSHLIRLLLLSIAAFGALAEEPTAEELEQDTIETEGDDDAADGLPDLEGMEGLEGNHSAASSPLMRAGITAFVRNGP